MAFVGARVVRYLSLCGDAPHINDEKQIQYGKNSSFEVDGKSKVARTDLVGRSRLSLRSIRFRNTCRMITFTPSLIGLACQRSREKPTPLGEIYAPTVLLFHSRLSRVSYILLGVLCVQHILSSTVFSLEK